MILIMSVVNNNQWTTVIEPPKTWSDVNFSELWRYRDLIMLLVRRDFVANYKQTVLGPLWFLIQPLLTTLVFTIIFGLVARIPSDGVPHALFYFSGIVMWNYFASCLVKTSDTFVANSGIFGKVYFPRLVVPISVVITNLITFAIQFTVFIILLIFFYFQGAAIKPGIWILATPLLLLQMAALGLAVGIIVSSMTTRYRDLAFLVAFGVQLWMYATPVVYPMSQIPAKWKWIFAFNPMASVIETFRHAFMGTSSPNLLLIVASFGLTLVLLLIGIFLFTRVERTFADTV